MKRGYIIGRHEVLDSDRFGGYAEAATEAIRLYRGRVLARGGRYVELEGASRSRNVLIEFASLEQALSYYRSPEYQAARAKRLDASITEIVAVEGIETPTGE